MTLRDLILKVLAMPDYIHDASNDPNNLPKTIRTTCGKEVVDIWVDGSDNVVVQLK